MLRARSQQRALCRQLIRCTVAFRISVVLEVGMDYLLETSVENGFKELCRALLARALPSRAHDSRGVRRDGRRPPDSRASLDAWHAWDHIVIDIGGTAGA